AEKAPVEAAYQREFTVGYVELRGVVDEVRTDDRIPEGLAEVERDGHVGEDVRAGHVERDGPDAPKAPAEIAGADEAAAGHGAIEVLGESHLEVTDHGGSLPRSGHKRGLV